ncbi:MAG: transposase [Candidatus Omnitrophica bacterium]|nr:transposase [Candidatus Omnitrophota bacterium]
MPSYARKHQLSGSFIYHLINRGNKKEVVFKETKDYLYFMKLLKEYSERFDLKIYHWILMFNHYHLLLEIDEPERISSCMAGLNRAYTCYYHKTYLTSGFLWQGRFKLQPVQKEGYLLACGRYIERNPIRANIVFQAQQYLFSSARFYCLGERDGVTTESPIFGDFGQDINLRRIAYKEFLSNFNNNEEVMFRTLDVPLGNKKFISRITKGQGRLFPKRRGRPRERIVV